ARAGAGAGGRVLDRGRRGRGHHGPGPPACATRSARGPAVIRVFIADDHAILRDGLRQVLSAAPDILVTGEARDRLQALRALEHTACEVLLLDLSLPVLSGAEVLRRLRASRPDLRVLILSMYSEEQYAGRLLAAGAAGYLSKDRPQEDLLAAIR